MKIVALSDTHMGHKDIKLPEGDVLIHAGDATYLGTKTELREFNAWLADQPFKHKLFIAGNHDRLFDDITPAGRQAHGDRVVAEGILKSATYLQDWGTTIDGVLFWGSPWQPAYNNWAFNLWSEEQLAEKWAKIPAGVDVLVTHSPPAGILDCGLGCRCLRSRIETVKPRVHIFGHIHRGHGRMDHDGSIYANVSIMNEAYDLAFRPTEIEINKMEVVTNG